jgi:hypothetical protein
VVQCKIGRCGSRWRCTLLVVWGWTEPGRRDKARTLTRAGPVAVLGKRRGARWAGWLGHMGGGGCLARQWLGEGEGERAQAAGPWQLLAQEAG